MARQIRRPDQDSADLGPRIPYELSRLRAWSESRGRSLDSYSAYVRARKAWGEEHGVSAAQFARLVRDQWPITAKPLR